MRLPLYTALRIKSGRVTVRIQCIVGLGMNTDTNCEVTMTAMRTDASETGLHISAEAF